MCGRATLQIEESSTSMKVARVTVMATIHGLIPRAPGRLDGLRRGKRLKSPQAVVLQWPCSCFDSTGAGQDSGYLDGTGTIYMALFGGDLDDG